MIRTFLRITLLLLLAAAVFAASAFVVPLLDGGQRPWADPSGAGVRHQIEAARKAGAERVFPKRYAAVKDALKRASFEMTLQLAGYWGTRDFSRPEHLMDAAQASAHGLWRDTVAHQGRTRTLAEDAIARAQEALDEGEAVAGASLQVVSVRSRLAQAAIQLRQAKTLAQAGRFDEALELARSAEAESFSAQNRNRAMLARFDDPQHLNAWKGWIRAAVESSRGPAGIAYVVVKEKHVLRVYKGGRHVRSVPVDLGANAVNQKMHAGDRATPEGLYFITRKKGQGASKYGLALLLNYPNEEDKRRFARLKESGQVTRRTGIGGLIEIHGQGGRGYDWTDGCIAPGDEDMRLLYNEAGVGTAVAIVGSDGDGEGPFRTLLRRAERYR